MKVSLCVRNYGNRHISNKQTHTQTTWCRSKWIFIVLNLQQQYEFLPFNKPTQEVSPECIPLDD